MSAPTAADGQTPTQKFNHDQFATASCVECHEANRPLTTPAHGENRNCIECHSPQMINGNRSWANLIKFDHKSDLTSCSQCHQTKIPNSTPHLNLQIGNKNDCIFCHVSSDWKSIAFDHTKLPVTSCIECHVTNNRDSRPKSPPNHPAVGYEQLDCIKCHNSDTANPSWNDLKFDHRTHNPNPQTCIECHANTRPSQHISNPTLPGMQSGECSLCHGSTNDWKENLKQFNHESSQPTSCVSCHQQDMIKNQKMHTHINGQLFKIDCIKCHTYEKNADGERSFTNLVFDYRTHNPAPTSCRTCHLNDNDSRPTTHSHDKFSRANNDCSTCHQHVLPKKWQDVTKFSHTKLEAGETCETCHASQSPILDKKPSNHVPTNYTCVECHTTEDWKKAVYKHSPSDTNCLSCHNGKFANDRPVSHKLLHSVQCSICHDQVDWNNGKYPASFSHPSSSYLPPRTKNGETLSHKNEKNCQMCHDNKSDSVKFKFNYGSYCASCHAEDSKRFIVHRTLGVEGIKNCVVCHTYSDWGKIL